MSSPSARDTLLLMLVLLCIGACEREARDFRASPAETTSADLPQRTPQADRAERYTGNAYQISQGQRLYTWMNCVGCHAHGGGDIGPPLMDATWRYGSSMHDIVATINQGRPNGMPSYRGKLTGRQMWQLAAYVRSLSGQNRKDAVSSRADEMSNIRPLTRIPERPEKGHDAAQVRVPPR